MSSCSSNDCSTFVQSKETPPSHVKFKTHEKIHHEVVKEAHKFIVEEKTDVISRLIVVGSGSEWTFSRPDLSQYKSTHFVVAPPHTASIIRPIPIEYRDTDLVETMHNMASDASLLVLMIRVSNLSATLWDNQSLLPYFTWDDEVCKLSLPHTSASTYRTQIAQSCNNFEYKRIKGLKQLKQAALGYLKQSPSDKAVLCFIHLRLNQIYNVIVGDNDDTIVGSSNLFPVFSFDHDGILLETLIVLNIHKWMTLLDVSVKHDPIESSPYNLNSNHGLHSHYTWNVEVNGDTRVSHVTLNQLFELDALWEEYVCKVFDIKGLIISKTLRNASKHFVINTFCNKHFNSCFECMSEMEGFQRLYYQFGDTYFSRVTRYRLSKQKFINNYIFTGVSIKEYIVLQT